ncbi:hypothetical protein D1872_316890 [compost metagenome]
MITESVDNVDSNVRTSGAVQATIERHSVVCCNASFFQPPIDLLVKQLEAGKTEFAVDLRF